ncbi:hypothetical protein G9A89_023049 [Geosiphon pyriformis]|nr:hypothetical protein G9A89_023049 [Geosiphon pyriformis]
MLFSTLKFPGTPFNDNSSQSVQQHSTIHYPTFIAQAQLQLNTLQSQDVELQIDDLRRRLETSPGNPYVYQAIFSLSGNYPTNLEVKFLLVKVLEAHGKYDKAHQILQDILQLDPRNIQARSELGYIYTLGNAPELAKQIYKEILQLDPANWEALGKFEAVINMHGDEKQLLEIYNLVQIKLWSNPSLVKPYETPMFFNLHKATADLLRLANDISGCVENYGKALQIAFNETLGAVLVQTFNHTYSGPPLSPVMIFPQDIVNIKSLLFPQSNGNLPGAEGLLSDQHKQDFVVATTEVTLQLVELIDEHPFIIANATCVDMEDLPHLSLLILYMGIALRPSPRGYRRLAEILATITESHILINSQGQLRHCDGPTLAIEYLRLAVGSDHKDIEAREQLAKLLVVQGQYNEALFHYKNLHQNSHLSPDAVKSLIYCNRALGWQAKNRGDFPKALFHCQRALSFRSDDLEALCSLWNASIHFGHWKNRGNLVVDGVNGMLVDNQGVRFTPKQPSGLMALIDTGLKSHLDIAAHFGDDVINQLGGIYPFLTEMTRGLDSSDPLIDFLQDILVDAWTPTSRPWINEGSWIIRLSQRISKSVQRRWYIETYGATISSNSLTRSPITDQIKSVYFRPKLPKMLPEPPKPAIDPFSAFTYQLSPRQLRIISHYAALGVAYNSMNLDFLPEHVIPPPLPPVQGRLKVGYISSDFRNHALGTLMRSVFGFHSRHKFEVFGYSLWSDEGPEHPIRTTIKNGCDHFYDAYEDLRSGRLSDRKIAIRKLIQRIYEDGIHILVNLNGYTAHDLNEVFAVRVAPIQIAHSFAGPSGAGWIDYMIADKAAIPETVVSRSASRVAPAPGDIIDDLDPESDDDTWSFNEKMIYMPDSYFVNDHRQIMADTPFGILSESNTSCSPSLSNSIKTDNDLWREACKSRLKKRKELFPKLPEKAKIFACFNQLYKVDPVVFNSWCNILRKVEDSFLWLLKFSDGGDAIGNLMRQAAQWFGEEIPKRILVTDTVLFTEHISRCQVPDLFLDTPMVNAHTTACDVLWPGTPVLTLGGPSHRMPPRVGISLLRAAFTGTSRPYEWKNFIATDIEDYENKAVNLLNNLYWRPVTTPTGDKWLEMFGDLMVARRVLFLGREKSPLFDTQKWVRNLERGFEIAWQRWASRSGVKIHGTLHQINPHDKNATVGPSIAILNKSIMEPGFNIGVKFIESRKKRRSGALEDNISNRKFATAKASSGHLWGFKTGNTTESDSVDMEEESLVKKTSFDYGKDGIIAGKDLEQTFKSSKIQTKRALNKLLRKIDLLDNDGNNIFSDKPVVLPPPLKNLINISVRRSFALDISLDNVFAGIIRVTFTSKLSLAQASKKAKKAKILVNVDLKKSSGHSNQTVIVKEIPIGTSAKTVHTVLSEFGTVVLIKIQLVGLWQKAVVKFGKIEQADLVTAYWSILIEKNTVHTCVINCHLVTYFHVRCAVVCFETAKSLNAIIETTPVLRNVNLYWFHLGFSKYAKCEKILSDLDKSRLATIYVKHLASVAYSVTFGGMSWAKIAGESSFLPLSVHSNLVNSGSSSEMKPTLPVMVDIEKKFAIFESSLTSLAGQISELAKRLDSLMSAVLQPSSGCQLLMTPPSQNLVGNIVMEERLGGTTGGETAAKLVSSVSPKVKRLETMLEGLSASVLSLTARFNGSILAGSAFPNPSSQ